MPMPQEYQRVSQVFDGILTEVRDNIDLATRNQAYTSLQSVLMVFRRRLHPQQILGFAALLPPAVQAIFVADWNEDEFVPTFGKDDELTEEVNALRRHHNFSGDNAIAAVTAVLRGHMDAAALDAILASLPDGARRFWIG